MRVRTIQGLLSGLKVKDNLKNINGMKVLSFNIENTAIELTSHKEINLKEGDEILVAGMKNAENIFKAFSFKKL